VKIKKGLKIALGIFLFLVLIYAALLAKAFLFYPERPVPVTEPARADSNP